MSATCVICNALLFAGAGYSMYQITPQFPYAFTACAFACIHGLLSLITCVQDGPCEPNEIQSISASIIELMPLPLFNIELFRQSGNNFAMGHAFFLVPLLFDLLARYVCDDGEDTSTTMLKDLTILCNIASLTYLGIHVDKSTYLMMAAAAFCSRFGSLILETYGSIDARNCVLFFDTVFFCLAGYEIGRPGGASGESSSGKTKTKETKPAKPAKQAKPAKAKKTKRA